MARIPDPYNAATRAYFENPVHAGDLQQDYNLSYQGEASESAAGARVQISIGLDGDVIQECRFRAFGCPHLIAGAEWLCDYHEGKTMADLAGFRIPGCMLLLGVPADKTGRLLLLEDAIGSLTDLSRNG